MRALLFRSPLGGVGESLFFEYISEFKAGDICSIGVYAGVIVFLRTSFLLTKLLAYEGIS